MHVIRKTLVIPNEARDLGFADSSVSPPQVRTKIPPCALDDSS